jgi:hypothetical protein
VPGTACRAWRRRPVQYRRRAGRIASWATIGGPRAVRRLPGALELEAQPPQYGTRSLFSASIAASRSPLDCPADP